MLISSGSIPSRSKNAWSFRLTTLVSFLATSLRARLRRRRTLSPKLVEDVICRVGIGVIGTSRLVVHRPDMGVHQRGRRVDPLPALRLVEHDVAVVVLLGHGVAHRPGEYRAAVMDDLALEHPLPEVLGRLGKGPDPLDDLHDRVAELLHLDAELRGIPGVHADLLDIPVLLRDLRLDPVRSEEHTSELQSRENLVCRLLLEKK